MCFYMYLTNYLFYILSMKRGQTLAPFSFSRCGILVGLHIFMYFSYFWYLQTIRLKLRRIFNLHFLFRNVRHTVSKDPILSKKLEPFLVNLFEFLRQNSKDCMNFRA